MSARSHQHQSLQHYRETANLEAKLQKIEEYCLDVAKVRRGGMDADVLAQNIIDMIRGN